MPFDQYRFAQTSQPASYLLGWGVTAAVSVYFVLGWLTFSLFLLSVTVKSYERQTDRLLVEIASSATPYVLPLGLLLLGVLLLSAYITALIWKSGFVLLFSDRSRKIITISSFVALLLAALLLSWSALHLAIGKGAFVWFAGAAYGIFWFAVSIFLVLASSLRTRIAEFLETAANLNRESPTLAPVALVSASAGTFVAASAVGNILTLLGLILLPIVWIFPNLDFLFGGFLDAHPFISYIGITSWAEFLFALLLVPASFFWFFFSNSFASAWIRAMLSAAAYGAYRGGETTVANTAWVSAGRLKPLSTYAFFFFRPLSYAETRFPIQSIVIQKSSATEAAENSRLAVLRDLPPAYDGALFQRSWPLFLLWATSSMVGTGILLNLLIAPRISFLIIFALVSLLLFALPSIFFIGVLNVFHRTFLYGWCLDKEFPEERTAYLPPSMHGRIHEIHKIELASEKSPTNSTETARMARPEQ